MDRPVYHAFIDESGDPHFSNGASSLFFVCATIVNDLDVPNLEAKVVELRKKYGLAELKSQKLHNDKFRIQVLSELNTWNIGVITIAVKKEDFEESGNWFKFKGTFYKYIERLLIQEVVRIFGNVHLTFDSYGKKDYRESFLSYIRKSIATSSQISLFDPDITMSGPQIDSLIQVSDIIAGSLRLEMDGKQQSIQATLSNIIKGQKDLAKPEWIKRLDSGESLDDNEIDPDVVSTALESVDKYLAENKHKVARREACMTLDYLRSTLLYDDPHKFCYRTEIKEWLSYKGIPDFSEEKITRQIVSALRQDGVIIASSQEGIKIPSNKKDLKTYFNFILGQTIPSLNRLKKINQVMSSRFPDKFSDLLDDDSKSLLNALREYV